MAGSGWGLAKALAIAVLFFGAAAQSFAQAAQSAGSLSGRLTDLHSKALEGVALVAHNQATGAEKRTITTKNGAYLFSNLEPGEYTLEAESPQLGRGRIEEIVIDAGHEARVQLAMEFEPLPPKAVLAALPKSSGPDLMPVALPVSEAALAVEPLQRFALREERLPGRVSIVPGTEATAIKLPLAAEPLQTLAPAATPVAQIPSKLMLVGQQQSGPTTTSAISVAELQALPVSGRHWQDFALDNTPASVTPAGGQGQIALRGSGQPAEIAVDGMSKSLAFGPTGGFGVGSVGQGSTGREGGDGPAGMAQIGPGGHGIAVSEAAIREVETAAGRVEAEADRATGRINEQTQSGSNELHGQGFLFDRQSAWGAQNPFTQWVKETGSNALAFPEFDNFQYSSRPTEPSVFGPPESYTPPDRETVWGIGAGSRIHRDKLFWFAALDSYQRNDPGVAEVKHPYLLETPSNCLPDSPCTPTPTGFFAEPSNDQMQTLAARLGLSSANAIADGLAAYSPMLESLAGLLGPAPRTAQQWTGFARLDWQASERQRFTLEGIGAHWNSPGGGLTRVSENYGNHSFGSTKASEEWLLGRWEAFLTPNLLAVTQASAGHALQEARPSTPSDFEKTFLAGNAYGQLPEIVVDNRYGFTIGNPSRFGSGSYPDEHLYHAQESLDWIRGKLLVKAGFEASHNSDATTLLRNQTGTYTYSNVENFISDALAFQKFGISGELDPTNQHTCDETGTVWRDSGGGLRGLGYLPCYSYYTQTIGPSGWHLSTNDWAGYASAQWQAGKLLVVSAGLRWEREQLPPPIAALANPGLLLTQKLPSLGNEWGPRVSLAVGRGEHHWPVLRLGYGMYYARTENAAVETALTQTGSLKGDLNFFMRPTDNLNAGGAPPFPYVLQGEPGSAVRPGAVEFAPRFHNPEIHQAVAAAEETLPGNLEVTASAMVSMGRRLPISIDTNIDLSGSPQPMIYGVVHGTGKDAGPILAPQITVQPFYSARLNPDYQQIDQITSKANSTYEAAMVKVERYGRRGLSLHAHYTYSHAMDWNPNESPLDPNPANFRQEYGTSDLNMRHSADIMAIYEAPWKLHGMAGKLGNNWMLSGAAQFRSGLPYTMRIMGSLAAEFPTTGNPIYALRPGMNGSGGDNRVYGVGVGSDGTSYNIGRNTYRYPATWKADLRLGRGFDLGHTRQLELLAESFNLFNHQNVTELETSGYYIKPGTPPSTPGGSGTLPTLNFLTGLKANTTAFGQPLNVNATNFYRERQIQLGLRMRF